VGVLGRQEEADQARAIARRRSIVVHYPAAGLRGRLAGAFSGRARVRRHERFFALTGAGPAARIVDVGCGELGLRALEPDLDVTGVDVVARPSYPGPFVLADATARLPFRDGEFDLAYCSSVIEHVEPERRDAFASELRRVARGWYVQTPAISFPIEPHALLPFAHWLSPALRRPYWRLGAGGRWDEVALLRRRDIARLFGAPRRERLGPLTKSWVSISPVGPSPDPPADRPSSD
jgi:SAM-dependent methyltransferase